MSGSPGAPGVVRAAKVLAALGAGEPLSASALAQLLGLRASSIADLCQSLLEERMVRKRADGTFVLGPRVERWGERLAHQPQVFRLFAPTLPAEQALDAYTVTLEVLTGAEVLCLASRLGAMPLAWTPRPGMRSEALASGAGRAIVRATSEEELERHLAVYRRHQGLPDGLARSWKAETARDGADGLWPSPHGTAQLSVAVPPAGGAPSFAAVVLHLPSSHVDEADDAVLPEALRRVAATLVGTG